MSIIPMSHSLLCESSFSPLRSQIYFTFEIIVSYNYDSVQNSFMQKSLKYFTVLIVVVYWLRILKIILIGLRKRFFYLMKNLMQPFIKF